MKILLTIRNRIETFYNRHSTIFGYIIRLALSFLMLLAAKNSIGYNTLLSQFWFILAFAAVCAFIKVKLLMLVMAGYIALQIMSMSMGTGLVALAVMLLLYLMGLRMSESYGYALALMVLSYIIKLPLVVPLILAVVSPISAVITVISGNIIYYMLHYININTAVITGLNGADEFTRASVFINGLFSYKEFIYTTLIMIAVFIAVFFLKKLNLNGAGSMAVAIGTGLYIVLMLVFNMVLNTITFPKLRTIIFGNLGAFVIAVLFVNLLLPLDYSSTQMLEFEDEEYYYYVKAVPKAALDKESIRITRISGRKKAVISHEKKTVRVSRDKIKSEGSVETKRTDE